ncbi:response regulator [Tuwongella immobilis]|uniref:histidine kinase n=1 Tax=Tuwongella immobilis TaxID=692036 RepID=A0A6C2YTG1_9BACT|nr:response regulator [Tuwongella immobilis]VIP04319.1 histidine partial : Response regulator receiver sensor hybrid histidine kinase OS=Stanieria cyanosphaera (strain ATCC 29371 / PCC 7437) GN=Sta7437_4188 PE=4 SV=1: HAMP: PAS: HisKA: HATPase_c: Response_reg: Response_reg [Tuwongella immobilis]VTS06000.1 histidine partial : Response regulator receiver sensor hybrid histidine kinase OS=Stanieria cyanosphaera (strain ATCC 29371 / PCC 7437) GN=Sta7437_4188 PE=4 SV=1: HAMP: PAS: HisKA: HATPase_c: Re
MRIGLGLKFSLAASLGVITATLITAYAFYRVAARVMTEHELVDLQDETALRGQELRAAISQVRADGYQLSGSQAARRVLRYVLPPIDPTIPPQDDAVELTRALGDFVKVGRDLFDRRPHFKGMQFLINSGPVPQELLALERTSQNGIEEIRESLQKRELDSRLASNEQLLAAFASTSGKLILSPLRRTPSTDPNHPVERDTDLPLELDAYIPVISSNPTRRENSVIRLRVDVDRLVVRLKRSPRHLVFLHDQCHQFLMHPKFLIPGTQDDPVTISADEQLERIIENAQKSILEGIGAGRFDQASLPRSPVAKDDSIQVLAAPHPWLVRSERLPPPNIVNRIEMDQRLGRLAEEFPEVRIGKLDPNASYIYLASHNQDAIREVQEKIRPGSSKELISNPNTICWEPPLACRTFAFQYVMIPLEEADPSVAAATPMKADAACETSLLPGQYFGLILAASIEEIDSEITRDMRSVMLWTLILGGGAALVAWLFSTFLIAPLKTMLDASQKLAKGEPVDLDITRKRGDEIGVLARSFADMANRVQSREEALRESETRMRAILLAAGDAIITLDDSGTIESANRAAVLLVGFTSESELVGMSSRQLIPRQEDIGATSAKIRTTEESLSELTSDLSSDSNLNFHRSVGITREFFIRSRQGRSFPVEATASEVMLPARRLIIVIIRDITERKRVEEQTKQMNEELDARVRIRTAELEQANHQLEQARDLALEAVRAKDSFVTNISHELRTPLTTIIGLSELQLEDFDPTNEDLEADLRKIKLQGDNLLGLVNDILDLAKIQAGKQIALDPTEFPMQTLVSELDSTLSVLVQKKNNRYTIEADATKLGVAFSDRKRIRQILTNLLSNAAKFTDNGRITLTADRTTELGTDWFVFRVRDTGLGMKPEELAHLFTPFYQADSSTSRKSQGTGIGLTITRQLCRLLGGDITVASEFGHGSEFTVKLPTRYIGSSNATRNETEEIRPPVMTEAPLTVPKDAKVLVIDDDPEVRELMGRNLSKVGFEVVFAENGEQGLLLARSIRPTAITLDAMMPGVDGWSVLAALKSDPKTSGIPIIMATICEERTRGFALGATDYLTKPIDWGRLAHILNGVLAKKGRSPILVVEDDFNIRDLTVRTLSRAGWQVLQACNGREALSLPVEEPPALILLDLMMPEIDGFQYVEELRARNQWTDVPIVVVTAAELTEADRSRLQGRVQQVLQKKAFGTQELMQQIVQRVARYADNPKGSGATP